MSEWICAGGVPGGQAAAQVPGLRGLVLAGGEERDQVEQRRTRRGRRGRSPDSPTPELRAHRRGLLVVELGQLGLDAARRPRPRRRPAAAACSATTAGTSSSPSSTLATNSTGLPVSGREVAQRVGRVVRAPARCGPGVPACSASITCAQPRLLGDRGLVAAARVADDAGVAALGLLEVGVDQLGLDRLDVAQRIDPALGVDDVRSSWCARTTCSDRVGLADVGQELVAEPLALVRARDEARDVVELDRVRDDARGADGLGDRVQPLVARRARRRRSARSS